MRSSLEDMCSDWLSLVTDTCVVFSIPRCAWGICRLAHLGKQGKSGASSEDAEQNKLEHSLNQVLQHIPEPVTHYGVLCQLIILGKMFSILVQQN